MINIIKNIFKDKENIDKSNVKIELDIPEKTKTEMFDEAVNEVVNRKIKAAIEKQLIEMCHSGTVITETEQARKEYPNATSTDIPSILSKYPNACVKRGYFNCVEIGLEFNVDSFIENITKDL